ncbi:sulfatase/phosphatase domain-containing protein, partial [Bacteroidota bacterium]
RLLPLHLEGVETRYYEKGHVKSVSIYRNNQLLSNQNWLFNGRRSHDNVFQSVDEAPSYIDGDEKIHEYLRAKIRSVGIPIADLEGNYAEKNAAYREAVEGMTEKERKQWNYQRFVKDYLRCVRSVDDGIGEILDYLDESGLAENTIVIYASDQGWYLGEHGWYDKRWMYEESLKTPLLIRWPGKIKAGSVNEDIVSNLDFAETFLDIAGVAVPEDMQGRSIVPVFQGNTPEDWRKSFYYQYYEFPGGHDVARHYGVTNGKYKLIHFYGPSHIEGEEYNEWELYDLEKDPNELNSVYADPEYSDIQAEMHKELDGLREELKVNED